MLAPLLFATFALIGTSTADNSVIFKLMDMTARLRSGLLNTGGALTLRNTQITHQ